MLISYAQNLEDILLYRALQGVSAGFYIDVGAYDPLIDSVTKLFYENGWNGINIEASPSRHERLVQDRPRDINLNLAAYDRKGTLTFHEIVDTGLSTSVEAIAERHVAAGFNRVSYTVSAETLGAVCREFVRSAIHFLKIDVEDAEEFVIRGADLTNFRPWIIVVEATEPLSDTPSHRAWEHLLFERNYEFVLFDGLSRIYVATEKNELTPLFIVGADNYRRATDVWTQGHLENVVEEHKKALEVVRDQLKHLSLSETISKKD